MDMARMRHVRSALFLFAVIALAFLAAGLHGAEFRQPRHFASRQAEQVQVSVAALLEQIADVPFWKQLLFWVVMFLLVLIAASVFSPELRKRILWAFTRLALLTLLIFYIIQNRERLGLTGLSNPLTEEASAPLGGEIPPEFVPPEVSPVLAYMVSVIVVMALIGLAWLVGRSFAAPRSRARRDLSLDKLADAARLSLDDLAAGRDWESAIIRCYACMSEVVSRRRGLRRDEAMTPAEFAARLETAGLPTDAVRRLTRLFESVRYGARLEGTRERDEAAACLNDILLYCGEGA